MTGPLAGIPAEVVAQLARVRLFVLDVDGTLTDGGVRYVEAGSGQAELMRFDVRDGQGLVWVQRELDVQVAWITGRGCRATEERARELGVAHLVTRAGPKAAALARLQSELDVDVAATLSMGDDLPDLALASRSALFACPADARDEVRARADLVTSEPGGQGAARRVCEQLLAAQGRWDAVVDGYAG